MTPELYDLLLQTQEVKLSTNKDGNSVTVELDNDTLLRKVLPVLRVLNTNYSSVTYKAIELFLDDIKQMLKDSAEQPWKD